MLQNYAIYILLDLFLTCKAVHVDYNCDLPKGEFMMLFGIASCIFLVLFYKLQPMADNSVFYERLDSKYWIMVLVYIFFLVGKLKELFALYFENQIL